MHNFFVPPMENVLTRVIFLRGAQCGAAFLVEHNNRQYLLTAAHIIGSGYPGHLDVKLDERWQTFAAELLTIDLSVDVAVLRFPMFVKRSAALLSMADLMLGQFAFFLGFPFLDYTTYEMFLDGRMPVPYVKWGAVAKITFGQNGGLVLDAMNNVGFSGGPVVFNHPSGEQRICGMTVGMKEESCRVLGAASEDTIGYVSHSAGLSLAVNATTLVRLIERNPMGVPVES